MASSYYPQINYLGAAQGMVGIIENAERQKLAEQESMRRQEEAQSLAKYRDMQIQKMQEEVGQKQRMRSALSEYASQMQTNPDFQPSMAQRAIEDPETANEPYPGMTTQRYMAPAKKTMTGGLGQFLLEKGLPEEGLTWLAKESDRKEKDKTEIWKEYNTGASKILASDSPQNIEAYVDFWKKGPHGEMFKDIHYAKVLPGGKGFETEFEQTFRKGDKNPLSGEIFDKDTRAEVKLVAKPDGTKEYKKVKEIEEKAPTRHSGGYGIDEQWNPETRQWDKRAIPVNPAGEGLEGLNQQLKELSVAEKLRKVKDEEYEKERQREKDKGTATDYEMKMLKDDSNFIKLYGEEVDPADAKLNRRLKPEALAAINAKRRIAGEPPLVEKEKKFQYRRGNTVTPAPKESLFTYVPDEKAAPVAPPRPVPGTGLSGMLPVKPPVAPVAPSIRTAAPMTTPPIQPGGGLAGRAAKTPAAPKQRALTKEGAKDFLNKAGGDRQKAEQMARDAGYSF